MIGQIGPFVKGDQGGRRVLWLHIAGGLVGGCLAGVLLGTTGVALATVVGSPWQTVSALLLAAMSLVAGLADLGVIPFAPMRWQKRQTPRGWSCALGPEGSAFGWAVDLSLGVTTIVSNQAVLVVLAAALLSGGLLSAVLVMVAFGLGRAASVAVHAASAGDVNERSNAVDRRFDAYRLIGGLGSLGVALLFLLSEIAR